MRFLEQTLFGYNKTVSRNICFAPRLSEYEKYRVIQDKKYVSDFDREVKKLLNSKKKKI